ncbi:hypothetical protein MA16_Dca007002 [Dendrobium catenatum]|uniref:Uncharacterized protein n=1 Tax=Dendrobium catenatum TaxID=906689 RepID=A0A2I0VX38_9ASPA|nr:hypothetical protein MA16_Dca007002 [Dendrobium catenatum]
MKKWDAEKKIPEEEKMTPSKQAAGDTINRIGFFFFCVVTLNTSARTQMESQLARCQSLLLFLTMAKMVLPLTPHDGGDVIP